MSLSGRRPSSDLYARGGGATACNPPLAPRTLAAASVASEAQRQVGVLGLTVSSALSKSIAVRLHDLASFARPVSSGLIMKAAAPANLRIENDPSDPTGKTILSMVCDHDAEVEVVHGDGHVTKFGLRANVPVTQRIERVAHVELKTYAKGKSAPLT